MTKILVSYRRADSAGIAGRIVDRLIARYGAGAVFIDVDSIPFGTDFRKHIRETLLGSSIVLAIVGRIWRGAGSGGGARIGEANDPVRVEIEMALQSGVTVVPVLIDGAAMPAETELPETLKDFAFLNAAVVESGRYFHRDVDRLIEALDRLLGITGKPEAPPPPRAGLAARWRERLRKPLFWAVLGGIALPFAASLAALGPPWPRGVVVVTAIVAAVAIVLLHEMLRSKTPRTNARVMTGSAIALAIMACVYLTIMSLFTYQTPATKQHWAKGFVCSAEALAVYKDKCPHLGIDELKGAEYEAERLWTGQSLTIVRVALVFSWLAMFLAGATLVAGVLARRAPEGLPLGAAPAARGK